MGPRLPVMSRPGAAWVPGADARASGAGARRGPLDENFSKRDGLRGVVTRPVFAF